MAIYEYRCDQDGVFEVMRPLGTAPAAVACPVCNREAPRIVSAPMILTTSRSAWSAAIERALLTYENGRERCAACCNTSFKTRKRL